MPSLVVPGIMERNGGFGELGCFGGRGGKERGLLGDDRALQLALDQLCLLGFGDAPGAGPGTGPGPGGGGGGGGGGGPAAPAAPGVPGGGGDDDGGGGGGCPPAPSPGPAPPAPAPPAPAPQPPAAPAAPASPEPPPAPQPRGVGVGAGASSGPGGDPKLCAFYKEAEFRLKSSCNTTECVPVPSSEHVAEIVGRQGCKIKALRAKTNTYIKTPVRGEEPVFMVTGRREDVATARREIMSAAEHFSMIRASRHRAGAAASSAAAAGGSSAFCGPGGGPGLPGQVTIRVRVPYRVVGLVVGPKGATVKRIQQQTSTYIVTPSRDRDPVFEITGAPGSVERAREEIETHIAVRTGKILDYGGDADFLPPLSPEPGPEGRPADAWRLQGAGAGAGGRALGAARSAGLGCLGEGGAEMAGDLGYGYLFPGYGVGKQDVYYGLADGSPPLWAGQEGSVLFAAAAAAAAAPPARPGGPHRPPSSSSSSSPGGGLELPALAARRAPGDPLTVFPKLGAGVLRTPAPGARDCVVCCESEVTAALVPCGHNLFCMECAVRICERTQPVCPVCHSSATQAIRIFS
ncbi:RNA-binding protein MEX3A [Ornithorhynchus anatinus]|uniref:Mex-3 RNA binding family member A n=1 Tax=Ornithorhynchus anatinus TaxID=9258 RepID=A0A6I8PAV8_ORNAN|nr:RNA-binding protein MEX3A [Ornithorhynchus anatinus]